MLFSYFLLHSIQSFSRWALFFSTSSFPFSHSLHRSYALATQSSSCLPTFIILSFSILNHSGKHRLDLHPRAFEDYGSIFCILLLFFFITTLSNVVEVSEQQLFLVVQFVTLALTPKQRQALDKGMWHWQEKPLTLSTESNLVISIQYFNVLSCIIQNGGFCLFYP